MSEAALEPQDAPETVDWGDSKYPPYVTSPAERERWDLCVQLAEATSRMNEESGEPDSTFVWHTTRALYNSDIPTGSPADRAPGPV